MSIYKRNIIINYPIEKVFKVFIDLNKQQIPKFNDKNPTEVSYKRVIKTVGKQKIEMITTVTGFEKNSLYEVTNAINKDKYISRYEFKEMDSSSTEILLSESQEMYAFSSSLTLLFGKITAKKKMKDKLDGIKEALELEIKRRYKETNDYIE